MFGYRDKRVTVRFTEKQFAEFEQLFSTPGLFSWHKKKTWTNLIHEALKDMHYKYVTAPASKLSASPAGASDSDRRQTKKISGRKSALTRKRK